MGDLESLEKQAWPSDGETADRFFIKPLSLRITNLLINRQIRPTHVTFLSFAFTLLGAFMFYLTGYFFTLLGAVLLYFSRVLDCVDGEIARAKHLESSSGGLIDYSFDMFGSIIVYLSISVALFRSSGDPGILILGILVAPANSLISALNQKITTLKKKVHIQRIGTHWNWAKTYFNYGGTAIVMIILGASLLNRLFEGMLLVGILSFSYAIAKVVEAYVHLSNTQA